MPYSRHLRLIPFLCIMHLGMLWSPSTLLAQSPDQVKKITEGSSSDEKEEETPKSERANDRAKPPETSEYYFTVDVYNRGLGARPDAMDLETPQSALESFFYLMETGKFEEASYMLDLRDIAPEEQRSRGAKLAERLALVLDRKVLIRWDDIVDRPDALNSFGSNKNPMAGEPRRSLRLERLDLEDRPVSIRLHRIKPDGEPPIWVFSRQTVGNIDPLFELYGPTRFENWLPDALRKNAFWGIQWWELIAFPLILLLASGAGFATYRGISWGSTKLEHERGAELIERAAMPAALFVGVLLTQMLTQSMFIFSATINTFLRPVLIGMVILTALLVALRLIDTLLAALQRHEVGDENIDDEENVDLRRRYTNIYAARRIALFVVVLIGLGVLLVETDIFQTLGISILATAGVASLVLGLAAQAMLGNIISSLQIAIAKPVHIGDSVYYEGDWAYVEAIHYTFVELRTWDLRRLIVPVQYFVSEPFENWSRKDPRMIKPISVVLDHTADVEALRQHWNKIAREDEDVDGEDWIRTLVTGHDDSGMTVKFYCSAADPTSAWRMHCRLQEKILAYIRDEHDVWAKERIIDASADHASKDSPPMNAEA